jgi:poly(glycerol-phosphate) alpha-glucosyltransferase
VFPKANYLIAASRLHPRLDGGYTIAVLHRLRHFRELAGTDATLLTFDFSPDYREHLAQFRRIGLAAENTVLRNLYQDARDNPGWLWDAARPGTIDPTYTSSLIGRTDRDADGAAWRTVWHAGDTVVCTDYLQRDGQPILRTPYLHRADWHRADEPITVFRDGEPVGTLAGFGELYRAWLAAVIADGDPALPTVVISESRQVGELIVDLRGPRVTVIHTAHNAHTLPPYRWDSEISGLWRSWFDHLARFDAVVWLTEGQRRDVVRRFGEPTRFAVIPHPAQPTHPTATPQDRDPNRAVMITRLAPQKQVEHAIRAFATAQAANPSARLDIYGEGPSLPNLVELIAELGLQDVVRLRGYRPDATEELDRAALLILSSRFEGQSLVITEAFARGCPVIAYDVNYGPREMISSGRNGYLVPAEDVSALAASLSDLLGHPERLAEFSAAARAAARQMTPEHAMARWAQLFERLLGRPRV